MDVDELIAVAERAARPSARWRVSLLGQEVCLTADADRSGTRLEALLRPFGAVSRVPAGLALPPHLWRVAVANVDVQLTDRFSWRPVRLYAGRPGRSTNHRQVQLVRDDGRPGDLTVCVPSRRLICYLYEGTADLDHLGHLVKMPVRHQLRRHGHPALHASVAVFRGRGLAFVGAKGAGKTSLLLALLKRGGEYLANDTAYVLPDSAVTGAASAGALSVHGWPNMIRIGTQGLSAVDLDALEERALRYPRHDLGPRVASDGKVEFYASRLPVALPGIRTTPSARLVGLVFISPVSSDDQAVVVTSVDRDDRHALLRSRVVRDRPGVDWLDLRVESSWESHDERAAESLADLPAWKIRMHPTHADQVAEGILDRLNGWLASTG